ncbi:hypothetical protein KDN34_16680 [Shewanella yunxiaonensis]|uniref:Uncharacterized protein n=1 Tax=Shewanella yunxiaonensis TaxID=2829809 RepID=A0ABX7YST6_9GAMM|nr:MULTISPECIES: hypothetical protein [Shewanella]MDF0533405.1 hypothetical protein [Shewanella sp. A32]QUN05787.1 hypothetical protein KDN34_16680 [Shewanella yunxiaonensis]
MCGIRSFSVAALMLLGILGSGLAQSEIVRWNAVVGVQAEEDSPNLVVGEFFPSPNWFWVEDGKVMFNLDSGEVDIQFKYLSWASNNPSAQSPIGAPLGTYPILRRGRFVCDARGQYGEPVTVSTETFSLDNTGSANYHGQVEVQQICRDYPDQIAFVVTGANSFRYFAFGAGQLVLAAH